MRRIGSGVDPSIRLTMAGPSRRFIASADDSPGLLTDARLTAELPEDGDYVVEISDSRYAGGGRPVYRLTIGPTAMAEEIYPLGGRSGETVGFELRGGTLKETQVAVARLTPLGTTFRHWPQFAVGPNELESLRPLLLSNVPEIREPTDPAEAPPRATAPVVFNGRLESPSDEDRFVLAVTPGQKLHIEVEASTYGSALDGVLQVLNNKGAEIAKGDDTVKPGPMKAGAETKITDIDPSVTLDVPADVTEITLVLRDLEKRGGIGFPYRIVAETVVPGFGLSLNDAQSSVPRGGSAVVGVTVVRKGYDGPITLSVLDPPAGLTFRPGTIAAGQLVGALVVGRSRCVVSGCFAQGGGGGTRSERPHSGKRRQPGHLRPARLSANQRPDAARACVGSLAADRGDLGRPGRAFGSGAWPDRLDSDQGRPNRGCRRGPDAGDAPTASRPCGTRRDDRRESR